MVKSLVQVFLGEIFLSCEFCSESCCVPLPDFGLVFLADIGLLTEESFIGSGDLTTLFSLFLADLVFDLGLGLFLADESEGLFLWAAVAGGLFAVADGRLGVANAIFRSSGCLQKVWKCENDIHG